jgi:hypothetical protein
MLVWVLRANGMIFACLTILLVWTLLARGLVLPPRLYLVFSILGFLSWGVFAAASGSASLGPGGLLSFIWSLCFMLIPFILPVEAGILGWLGARSPWRWCFLAAGVLVELLPLAGIIRSRL